MMIRHHKIIYLLLFLLFLSSAASPVSASAGAGVASSIAAELAEEQVIGAESLGKVAIGEASYMEVQDVMLLPGDQDGMVTFTVNVHNGGVSELSFKNYWVRLQSKAGNTFAVNQFTQSGDTNRIAPGTSQSYSFYAKVNVVTELQDLVFKLVQLDFSVAGFERVIGQLMPASDYTVVTPVGATRSVRIDGTPFYANIERMSISRNDDFYLPSVYFEMENKGTSSAKLPDLSYYIRTAQGHMYPLQAATLGKGTELQPLAEKEGLLSGSIPREAGAEGWQLVIMEMTMANDGKSSLKLPVAYFAVPEAVEVEVSLGNDYEFSNKSGTYTARLTSLQRLPWEDQDILAANITLTNKGGQALSIPNLKGYFELDDAMTVEASLIQTDRVISLQPGKEINLQLAGKIPYTSDFKDLNLVLQEKAADGQVSDLLTFHHNKELMGMKVVPAAETRTLTDIGQSTAYSVRSTQTFAGESADLFTVQLSVENLEKRFTDLRKQVAQFRAEDGTVFPAHMSEITNKVIPGGKALIYIYATIPKGYQMEDLQLILGDAVTFSGAATDKGGAVQEDGYVNAAVFQLPDEIEEPQGGFAELDVYPYTITLSHIGTQINFVQGTVMLDFDYELKRDTFVETSMKDHSLIVELKDDLDRSGKEIIVSQTYALDGVDPTKSLQIGFHDATITYTNKDKIYQIGDMKTYQLNVYHQFQNGQKKLLATKELDWFVFTD
ncbi:hypothetical protein ASG89_14835 [Paenibacillus sp. Soil766]|uniref:hypothetical protein n=1 Tax=Paenibacillus sp. Soil766 TaxID=1736404 RepID=UPI00070F25C0|nr:hypothetical protein [Paenibacillus sp. Soil766]KRE82527.1 hypothetical protein ASG89_14835 [Paenibacillus sp. Soil766]